MIEPHVSDPIANGTSPAPIADQAGRPQYLLDRREPVNELA